MTAQLVIGILFGMAVQASIDFLVRSKDRDRAFTRGVTLGKAVRVFQEPEDSNDGTRKRVV